MIITMDGMPPAHLAVIEECIREAHRNLEQGDALTEADVAADIVRRLNTRWPQANEVREL